MIQVPLAVLVYKGLMKLEDAEKIFKNLTGKIIPKTIVETVNEIEDALYGN